MYREACGGGKGGGNSYDPQIGASASQAAAVAARAQEFSEKYYNDVITPLLKQNQEMSLKSQDKLNSLYDLNADQMKTASDRYKQYGIPAEERYYKMVDQYSQPEEQERQAQAAKGDFSVAQAGQNEQMQRQMAARGIDPTSPAAMATMGDMSLQGSAMQAAAMNRARDAARNMGMQLTADAANFGRGGQSGILQFGQAAGGNATGAFGIANQALGTGMQAGNSVMQGYQTAMSGYNNIMDNYSKLGAADIQAKAQSAGGAMQGLGQLAGVGMQFIPGFGMCDRRAKQDIRELGTTRGGHKLYAFRYKPEHRERWGHGVQVGVIAQEVQERMPEAVHTDEETGLLVVDYGKL